MLNEETTELYETGCRCEWAGLRQMTDDSVETLKYKIDKMKITKTRKTNL